MRRAFLKVTHFISTPSPKFRFTIEDVRAVFTDGHAGAIVKTYECWELTPETAGTMLALILEYVTGNDLEAAERAFMTLFEWSGCEWDEKILKYHDPAQTALAGAVAKLILGEPDGEQEA